MSQPENEVYRSVPLPNFLRVLHCIASVYVYKRHSQTVLKSVWLFNSPTKGKIQTICKLEEDDALKVVEELDGINKPCHLARVFKDHAEV